jgi:deazaflavin-dependent oxidoreductase (nitroreductase family)
MGVATELSYSIPRSNAAQKWARAVASSRPVAWTLARMLPTLDRGVTRLTRGRTTVSQQLTGLPLILVTTRGRRSGELRPTQLVGIPVGDTLALMGTNFGQVNTPAWVLNLEAYPHATVTHREAAVDVVARPASEAERTEILNRAVQVYAGYPKYISRVPGRHVRIFVLESASEAVT